MKSFGSVAGRGVPAGSSKIIENIALITRLNCVNNNYIMHMISGAKIYETGIVFVTAMDVAEQ